MQTQLLDKYLQSPEGQTADSILRSCVHCGFCTATCPTYQLLGDELDSPRGRIYLIKQVLEGKEVTSKTQTHLDRCLTCRSCETTCPSGVQYATLVDIGRHTVEQQVGRPLMERLRRTLLRKLLPNTAVFGFAFALGRLFRPALPGSLKQKIPPKSNTARWPVANHQRKMLVLEGCVQSVATPQTNAIAARLLDKLGIELIRASAAGCCGAVSHHLNAQEEGLNFMRRNIDAWWPYVEQGAEAIVSTASGCGVQIKDYARLLQQDPAYAEKAAKISELAKDISEILSQEDLTQLGTGSTDTGKKLAFHSPCTLQHGQKILGQVEKILSDMGYQLTPCRDSHLCCGSAGTYSLLQPLLSQALLDNKVKALQAPSPHIIVTANIGCQMHLASKASVPVKHWIELLDSGI